MAKLKKELEEIVEKLRSLPYEEKKDVMDSLFKETYVDPLKKPGDVVVKVGLYKFERKARPGRKGRNPQTGAELKIAPSEVYKSKINVKIEKKK